MTTRFASFNASFNRNSAGELIQDLSTPDNAQASTVAEIIQRANPDVVLVNEFDFDEAGEAADLFRENYLEVAQANGVEPVKYPFVYVAPSNTGIPSGFDFDNDGDIGGPGDAFGFGFFPGQFGMVLYSKFPIQTDDIRTFQTFLWKDMPGALLPDDPSTPEPADWYSEEELEVFRLSSKSHWDIPIEVDDGEIIHVLASHPTPPVFDPPEVDFNGRRNHDEIRFWSDYVTPGAGDYIYDDAGNTGGLETGAPFIVMGDQNADPFDGDSTMEAARQLTDNPLFNNAVTPASAGGPAAAERQGGTNNEHVGLPEFDTADFSEPPGNIRADYALPSRDLEITDAQVFWPTPEDPLFDLVGDFDPDLEPTGFPSSDHRLVYVDVASLEVPTSQERLSVTALEFLGEDQIATGTEFEGTTVGGLSGIAYDADNDVYYAIADDRSQINPARYYTLSIDLSDGRLDVGDAAATDVTTLLGPDLQPFPEASVDPEGIALTEIGSLFISSEGDANALIDPFVNEFALDGRQLNELPVPDKFLPTADQSSGIRNNAAFESLTISPDQRSLYTATEDALFQDGPRASLEEEGFSRIVQYDLEAGEVAKETVYPLDPIAAPPNPADEFAVTGLVELLALDNAGTLLALERSFSVGVGNNIRLYEIQLQNTTDVRSIDGLADGEGGVFDVDAIAEKRLLADFSELGILQDNIEGMALGPVLPDGRQSLAIVSDNNFSDTQVTQFLAFAIKTETIPVVEPTLETPELLRYEDPADPQEELFDPDDPAIYLHPDNPDDSFVITALKNGGFAVYDLAGQELQLVTPDDIRYNNVDLVYDFELGEETVDLAVFSDRRNDSLAIYAVDPETGQLAEVTAPSLLDPAFSIFGVDDGEATAYGLVTYTSPVDGSEYAFTTQADGNLVAQLELQATPEGLVDAAVVRTLELPVPTGDPADSQSEGLVVDRELGVGYVALEEEVGILKFAAEPNGGDELTLVQPINSDPDLAPTGFDELIVFGDSGVDIGNVFTLTEGTFPPAPPYFPGSFSNGPQGIELFAAELGFELTNSLAGGTNFGFGGAAIGEGANEAQGGIPNVGTQIGFYEATGAPSPEDDLFFISAGANNFIDGLTTDPTAVVGDLVEHVTALAELGAQSIALGNLPLLGTLPATADLDTDALNALSVAFNTQLAAAVPDLEADLGIDIFEVDTASFLAGLLANPELFGFTNTTDPALNEATLEVVPNPDEFVFWDNIHPTAAVQELFAQFLSTEIPAAASDRFVQTDTSPVVPDIEGLTIYYGEDGEGYLIASSQGDSTYSVFSRTTPNDFLGSFAIAGSNSVDGVQESDGLDIINVPLGDFESGLLVVQDGSNEPQVVFQDPEDGEVQNFSANFKYIDLAEIADTLDLDLSADGYDPRAPEPRSLVNGIASGDTTQDSTVLWARSTFSGELTFEYSTDPNFATVLGTLAATVTDPDVPVKVEIDGLQPDTEYLYRVTDAAGATATAQFTTSDELGTYDGLRFGATGDWQQAPPYPSLSNADSRDLELFVKLGDTIFADSETPALPGVSQARELSEFRTKQAEVLTSRFGQNTVPDLYATTSILSSIDDHELVDNFAGGAAPGESPDAPDIGSSDEPLFADDVEFVNDTQAYENALQAFQDYHPLQDRFYDTPEDPRTDGERQLYRFNTYGSDAAVAVLDSRSFRDAQVEPVNLADPEDTNRFLAETFDPSRTLLGEAQLELIQNDLLAAQEDGITWKFVVIPEPIQNFGLVSAEDRFEGYAAERARLLGFIDENEIENVVFLAGDFHGTIVNNLTYQMAPGAEPIPLSAFEVVTGPAAFFDGLFGPTLVNLGASAGLLSPEELAFYNSLPIASDPDSDIDDRDDFVKNFLNEAIAPFGFDPFGLNDNLPSAQGLVESELLQGDYVATHTFGWTEFDIDEFTQTLTVTTYGIDAYSEADLLADPESITSLEPHIVSQFEVTPQGFEVPLVGPLQFGSLGNDTLESSVDFAGDRALVFAGGGNDLVDTSVGFEASFGGNRVFGGSGSDELFVGAGDRVNAGPGDDTIDSSVGGGLNRIYAGDGDDLLLLGTGDRALGQAGADRFFFPNGGGDSVITGGADADQFWIANGELPEAPNTVTDFTGGEDVIGVAGLGLDEFADLTLTGTDDTTIAALGTDLAVLLGVGPDELGAADFAIVPGGVTI